MRPGTPKPSHRNRCARPRDHSHPAPLPLALALALLLATPGCNRTHGNKPDAPDPAKDTPPVPVEVAPLTLGPIESTIQAYTHLEAEQEVKVFARTANRVTHLNVEEGDVVPKDHLLLRLDDDIQKSQLGKAQARAEKARQEQARLQALFQQQLISEQVFSDAQFELRQLELALEDAQRELDYTEVRAPIAGTVTRRLVKYGDLVNLNQHLFDLVDFQSLVARLYIPEKHLPDLAPQQPVRIRVPALAQREFPGFVQRISPIVESRSGLIKVTVAFRDPGPLRPGMYVDAEIVTAAKPDALLLPKRALVYDGDQTYAYRIRPDQRVERLLVEPLLADRFHLEPRQGLQAGDLIVVAGQTGLREQAKIKIQTNSLPTSPPAPSPATNAPGNAAPR